MKPKIVFLGNAQAQAMFSAWYANIAGTNAYENRAVHYSFISDIDKAAIEGADVIVQQVSDKDTYDIDTSNLNAEIIRFPYVNGAFLWPYSGGTHPVWNTTKMHECGAFNGEHGDSFLTRLYRDGIQAPNAIEHYATLDIVNVAKIERRYEIGLALQRIRDQKAGLDFSMADYIDKHISREILFLSRQRLARPIFWHLARDIFSKLLRLLGDDEAKAADGERLGYIRHWGLLEMPIHPKIASHFGVPGISESHKFAVNLARLTFDQYTRDFMNCTFQEDLHAGMRMVQRGESGAAIPILQRGLAAAPRSPEGAFWLSQAYARLGREDEALKMAHAALDGDDENRDFLFELARCYRRQNLHDAAIAALKRSLQIDPWYPEANRILCELLVQQGCPEQAIALARNLADGLPSHAFAHWRLSQLFREHGDLEGAEKSLRRAISSDERDERAWRHLAGLLALLGRGDEAGALARIAENIQDAASHVAWGLILWRSGRLEYAEQAFRTAIRLAPRITHYKAMLADLLSAQGRLKDAIALGRLLVEEQADSPGTHALLGLLLWRGGDLAAAAVSYRRAIESDPANANFRIQCSLVHAALGDLDDAAAVIQPILGQDNDDTPAVQVHVGDLYLKSGDLHAAKSAFMKALALDANNTRAKSGLQELHRRRAAQS